MSRPRRRIAIFAEGARPTDPDLSYFVELWSYLAQRCGLRGEIVTVVGFSKPSIVAFDPPPKWHRVGEKLDVLIDRTFGRTRFDEILIAFDLEPKHDGLPKRCPFDERDKLLAGLAQSTLLPQPFRRDADALRRHYAAGPRLWPLGAGRPPRRLSVHVLLMKPEFESLLLADEPGVRRLMKVPPATKGWPSFKKRTLKPAEHILEPATRLSDCHMPRSFQAAKHNWANFIVRRLPENSKIWRHPIVERLRLLLG